MAGKSWLGSGISVRSSVRSGIFPHFGYLFWIFCSGFSCSGFSCSGFSCSGFSCSGFSCSGFSCSGFSCSGFSCSGFSCSGFSVLGVLFWRFHFGYFTFAPKISFSGPDKWSAL
ncbi:hypothetical protein FTO70_09405 [Methanosarcina sp. KYL-1]|nr:hypothetical protein [Methanosarcina sp. KYL-1]